MSEQRKLVELLEKIDRKLGFLIGEKVKVEHNTITKQVGALAHLTKDYNEISFILRITPSHAAKELSKLRGKSLK